ncbi:MAG: hypothetical protein PCFJNLEI_00707 [Verrucomicrobiae bacterium]|nr:hypothetical protein [Verrucomicrobiae bacterium]
MPILLPAVKCRAATDFSLVRGGGFRYLSRALKIAFKPVTLVFVTKVVDYVLRFGTSVIIARYLGPADKGVLTFATLVVSWVVTFGNFSFMDANIFLMGSRRFSLPEALGTLLAVSIVSGVFYAGLMLGLVAGELVSWPVGNHLVFYALLLTIPFNLLLNNLTTVIQGLGQFTAFNVSALVRSVSLLVWMLLAMWLMDNRLLAVTQALVGSNLINAVGLTIYLSRRDGRRPRFAVAYLKAAFHYGIRSQVRLFLAQLSVRLDSFALGVLLPAVHLGWYSIATSLREALLILPESISVVLFPRVAANHSAAAAVTARACRINLVLMVLGGICLALVARPLVWLVYGPSFLPAVEPLQWLLIAVLFQSTSRILINYIYGMNRPQLSIWSTGASGLTMALLVYPLVKNFGMVGAAWTTMAAFAAGTLVDLIIVKRLSALPIREFLLPKKTDLQLRP